MRKYLKYWLRFLASQLLLKYQPRIVAITGSTGKTSTKDAIFAALAASDDQIRVAKTQGNLNTEFGVTANIIDPTFAGNQAGDKMRLSPEDVIRLSWQALKLIIGKASYPEILVLELAADRPGDIRYFMEFIQPEVGVLTNIGDVHLEFFADKASLVEEKGKLIAGIDPRGLAVLNRDDDFSNLVSKKTLAKGVFVGRESDADFRAIDIGVSQSGLHFTATYLNRSVQVALPVFGQQFIYAALAALAVADYFGVDFNEAARRLLKFKPAPGRFERIDLGDLVLIDDTYNANPVSSAAALDSLARLGGQRRKVAILGDMKELGNARESGHQAVGQLVAKTVDFLIVVGEGGKLIREAAIKAGFPEQQTAILSLGPEAADALFSHLRDNDIVLVKGSRAVHMDRVVDLIKQKFGGGIS